MRALLLTLGHNSSAAFLEDGKLLCAYETERVTGAKSDSRFPEAVLRLPNAPSWKPDVAYVTHWEPTGSLSRMSAKHWRPDLLEGVPIVTLNPDLSHHDTHMYAAIGYAGPKFPRDGTIGLVVDGFGTHGEHFSVYRIDAHGPTLLARYRGYDSSLGLWYQYATAYMGMKMHEDEYKLLGYEVHLTPTEAAALDNEAAKLVPKWLESLEAGVYMSPFDPVFKIDALAKTKQRVFDTLLDVAQRHRVVDPTGPRGRTVLAYFVQRVLEQVVLTVAKKFGAKNLILSGGVFYNVKLNLQLLRSVEGQVCVYPLAGDQGNAFGLYSYYNPNFEMPDSLLWGRRDLKDVGEVEGLRYFHTKERMAEYVVDRLDAVGRINVVRGAMEFGPRALCNTSTLALPTAEQVDAINAANDRNTVMPMAPVMSRAKYNELFEPDAQRVWKSDRHMVIAVEHQQHPDDRIVGISHKYTVPHLHHTSRPQVTSDQWLLGILGAQGGVLINTSFNYHGKPIAFGMAEVIDNHRLQRARDPKIETVVLTNA